LQQRLKSCPSGIYNLKSGIQQLNFSNSTRIELSQKSLENQNEQKKQARQKTNEQELPITNLYHHYSFLIQILILLLLPSSITELG